MSGTTVAGIRYPDGATKAKNLGPELAVFATDVDTYVRAHAIQGIQGDIGPQGLPGVNATPADAAVAGYIGTSGTSATKTALTAFVSKQQARITAVSVAARDAYFGVPATEAARLTLQNSGARTLRTDLGYEEAYYATYNATTNPGGATPAGWYPAMSGVMSALARRSATALTIPTGSYTDISASTYWSTTGPAGIKAGGINYSNGLVAPVAGIYEISWSLLVNNNTAAGCTVNATGVPSFTALQAPSVATSAVGLLNGTARTYIPAGGIVRLFAIALNAAVAVNSDTGHSFALDFIRPART